MKYMIYEKICFNVNYKKGWFMKKWFIKNIVYKKYGL